MTALDGRLTVAVEVARAAGDLLLDYQQRTLTVRTKSTDTDPVSEADHASEALVMRGLHAAFPDDGRLGEEAESDVVGSSGLRWVVDPLDGTVNYLYGLSSWAVSIGCQDVATGEPVLGVVHHPTAGETFVAIRGRGARLLARDDDPLTGGLRLRVRTPADLSQALVSTGFSYGPKVRAVEAAVVAELLPRVRDIRRAGAAALDLVWTAAGRLDGHGEYGLGPWDWMAGAVVVREAGGTFEVTHGTLAGEELTGVFAGTPDVVAALRGAFEPHVT